MDGQKVQKKQMSLNDGYVRLFAIDADPDDDDILTSDVKEKGKRQIRGHVNDHRMPAPGQGIGQPGMWE